MAGFLLDTNVLSEFARSKYAEPRVHAWLKTTPEETLFISVLTFAEIRRGIELLASGKRRMELEEWLDELCLALGSRLLPVTKAIADRWAVLSVQAQRRGTPLPIIDGMIAATALEHGLTVATRNVRDFVQTGAKTVNPWNHS